jgi:hypothetical protein
MKDIDFIQLNKLSILHNYNNIIFCKTDYLLQDFQSISKHNNDIILISGNSDYPITDEVVKLAPKNIKKWYCQNAVSNNDIIFPIPIGLENKIESHRKNHGIDYLERMTEKEHLINSISKMNPTKFIYANYNDNTNIEYRSHLTHKIKNISHITYQSPNISLKQFFSDIADHKMVLCPIGNGIDTHRLWETLYCDRIPVTLKVGSYKIYELYKKLPIIVLESIEELLDQKHMIKLYDKAMSKPKNSFLLSCEYWKKLITSNNKI